ncbi:MAG: DUF2971 domain-containing protein [Melioribacteraceae bacterium]|nr:DUF2971 domain-containing protein [Melioribacteraceae bacterium]
MKAYKFRSSEQIAFAFDIIIKRRLYCSDWKDLNDPMEGMYAYNHSGNTDIIAERVKGIRKSKEQYKICSLSETFDSHLLWAHYAGGFNGVAIELNLPDNDSNIKKVEHRGVYGYVDMNDFTSEEEAARTILFSKYDAWKYEKEIRILNRTNWYNLDNQVTRVIAGHRMSSALFEVLNITCTNLGIELCRLGIGDEGLDADYVKPFKNFRN